METVLRIAVTGAISLGYSLALLGWGRLGEYLLRVRWPPPMTVCLGLAVVIFFGGWLNLLGVAFAAVLDVVAAIGILLSVGALWVDRSRNKPAGPRSVSVGEFLGTGLSAALILAAFLFQVVFLTPPATFNIYDDFETYMGLAPRMLQTGTLDPGAFSNIGINTLGAQVFLQGFVAAHWPVDYIDAVDALFGLTLSGTLILFAGRRLRIPGILTPLAIAVLISINSQSVNVSTVYIGSALLIFLLFLPLGLRADGTHLQPASTTSAFVTGVLYASLVALKSTFVLVAAIHLAIVATTVLIATRRVRASMNWCLFVALGGCCSLLPWILIHAYKILPAVPQFVAYVASPVPGPDISVARPFGIFSGAAAQFGFGASYSDFSALIGVALISALIIAFRAYGGRQFRAPLTLYDVAGCLTLPAFYAVQMLIVGAMFVDHDTALRYAVPVFIAIVPAAIVLSGRYRTVNENNAEAMRDSSPVMTAVVATAAASVIWALSTPLTNRIEQAIRYRSVDPTYYGKDSTNIYRHLAYSANALSSYERDYLRKIQYRVPAGETMLSYVSISLHYDFSRNRILTLDAGGLEAGWLDFPFEGTVDDAERFFVEHGAEYILWQYRGLAVLSDQDLKYQTYSPSPSDRKRAHNKLAFNKLLQGISERSEILHDDGSYRLVRIRRKPGI